MWLHGGRQVARAEAVSIPGDRRVGIQAVRFVPFRVVLVWYIVLYAYGRTELIRHAPLGKWPHTQRHPLRVFSGTLQASLLTIFHRRGEKDRWASIFLIKLTSQRNYC
jgi:hypothetical protein